VLDAKEAEVVAAFARVLIGAVVTRQCMDGLCEDAAQASIHSVHVAEEIGVYTNAIVDRLLGTGASRCQT
jgi:hypothetical protein